MCQLNASFLQNAQIVTFLSAFVNYVHFNKMLFHGGIEEMAHNPAESKRMSYSQIIKPAAKNNLNYPNSLY